MVCYFFRLELRLWNVDPLKGGSGQMSPMPFFVKILLRFSCYFLLIKYLMLNSTKCMLAVETFAIFH